MTDKTVKWEDIEFFDNDSGLPCMRIKDRTFVNIHWLDIEEGKPFTNDASIIVHIKYDSLEGDQK